MSPIRVVALLGLAAAIGCHAMPRWLREPSLEERVSREDLAEGRDAYRRACADCHGLDGRGDGAAAKGLQARPSDLSLLSARHGGEFPETYVLEVMTCARDVPAHGTREMPVWRERFGPSDAPGAAVASFHAVRQHQLLVDYLATIQRRP